jgi:hypothetical protein
MKAASLKSAYRARLVEKRRSVLSGLGVKFDTLARMGRVAEDDQAQISHDEFISLHVNTMDYAQLRQVEEALDRLRRASSASASRAKSLSRPRGSKPFPGRDIA